jgi:peptide/nickel transport system permease protein
VIRFILRRILVALPTLALISLATFVVIELPEGDFFDQKIAQLREAGDPTAQARVEQLRLRYGFDRPFHERYWKWISGVPFGDFGESFQWEREVSELVGERIGWTLLVSLGTMFFVWALAIPLGIWSATKAHTLGARTIMGLSYLGMSLPGFLVALVALVLAFHFFGVPLHGLFSAGYRDAPWSAGKLLDLLQHLVPEEPRVLGAWSIAAPATSFPESFYFSEPGREGAAQ